MTPPLSIRCHAAAMCGGLHRNVIIRFTPSAQAGPHSWLTARCDIIPFETETCATTDFNGVAVLTPASSPVRLPASIPPAEMTATLTSLIPSLPPLSTLTLVTLIPLQP